MFIYKIVNRINGKIYIGLDGSSPDLMKRWYQHRFMATHTKYEARTALCRAMRKYGIEQFTCEVIDTAESYDQLQEKEIQWISFYKSIVPIGYNMTIGGEGSPLRMLPEEEANRIRHSYGTYFRKINKERWSSENKETSKAWINSILRSNGVEEKRNAAIKADWDSCSIEKKAFRRRGLLAATENRRPSYVLIDPDGNEFVTNHIQEFCKDRNLEFKLLQDAARVNKIRNKPRLHKGWLCKFRNIDDKPI